VSDLNRLHRSEPALHQLDSDPDGFQWTQPSDPDRGLLSFLRYAKEREPVLVVCNFTPVVRDNVLAGVPTEGFWQEVCNSDAAEYGGSGVGNLGGVATHPVPNHGMPHTLTLTAPPLACIILRPA
jgi:1,4-alpha-glucan branching enzyme